MKYIFFVTLLVNILFFLWEFNSPTSNAVESEYSQNRQQFEPILLLSEVNTQIGSDVIVKKDELVKVNSPVVAERKPSIDTVPEPSNIVSLDKKESNQLIIDSTDLKPDLERQDELPLTMVNFANKEEKSVVEQNIENNKLIEKTTTKELIPFKESERSLQVKQSYCYEIGPFDGQDTLDKWLALNKKDINSFQQIEKVINKNPRYLVYYPAADSFELAKENEQLFKNMGVTDIWLFRKGEFKGAISFGLFGKESSALDLQTKLADMGLDVDILYSENGKAVFYLEIETEKGTGWKGFNMTGEFQIKECSK
jgi:hypothetical protein